MDLEKLEKYADIGSVYCEIYDLFEGKWVLCMMPPDQAFKYQLMLGGEFFHYVDESMIDFQED